MFIYFGSPTRSLENNPVARRRMARAGLSGVLMVAVSALLGVTLLVNMGAPAVAAQVTPTSCYEWAVVQSPDPGDSVYLDSIAAIAANDVWAVGHSVTASMPRPLTEHWDGTNWSVVPSPNAGTGISLFGVAAVSSGDVWAVGNYDDTPVTELWNGSAWSIVPSPNVGTYGSDLNAVAAKSSSDVWAVGNFFNAGNVAQTLIEHWNGSAWSVVPSPNVGTSDNNLYGIAAVSSSDAWAVGSSGTHDSGLHTLIEHWNGSAWNVAPSPDLMGELNAVAAVSSSDMWAVGDYSTGGSPAQTLIEHWNGRAWSIVPSPVAPPIPTLNAIAVVSSRDVWAVGESYYYCNGCTFKPLIEHWNGTQWSIVPSPGVDRDDSLRGVAAVSGRDVWAVGYYIDTNSDTGDTKALVERYTTCVPATNTPTVTPTPQPPPCPGERFTDVCPGDYFYSATMALTRDDILSGYYTAPPCDNTLWIPCFKPSSNVTRGQIAKVASLAAGFNEPVNGQTFYDVPPGSTFYDYVERMASRGIMQGYPSGDGHCPQQSSPCFIPNRPATRGQLSKVIALTFDFNEPVSGQSFHDIPPTSTFYLYIERLANRGIINGYPCGGAGEPCVPPDNLPYFRPNNNVTRGQLAKIVQLARTQPTPTPTATATASLTAVATATTTPATISTIPVATHTPTPVATIIASPMEAATSTDR